MNIRRILTITVIAILVMGIIIYMDDSINAWIVLMILNLIF